jgi:hypothetical protein
MATSLGFYRRPDHPKTKALIPKKSSLDPGLWSGAEQLLTLD